MSNRIENIPGMSAFRGVRISKFRHVYGHSSRRENCYEGLRVGTSAHDGQCCAVNPKFVAVIVEVAGGGTFQVIPINWTGKVDYHSGRVSGHQGVVCDLKWNPFNDNNIASASEDGTVKLWHIFDDIHRRQLSEWLIELCGHSRRVSYIEWHPTAENILASAGLDRRILLWNVSSGECLVAIDCHPETILSLSFNKCGSLLATTCKDHILRLLDARTGQLLQQGSCHDGAKAAKVVFVSNQRLLTTGTSKSSRRQMAIWNTTNLKQPLSMQELDCSSGLLIPIYDADLNILYIAGKGDGNVRYYEISDSSPYVQYLSEFQSRNPQRGFGYMPKRGLNVSQCEIFRFYKVHTTQSLIEPIAFIVPRKSETFQSDLYPPTAGPTPSLTADEWLCGMDRDPVLISLRAGFVTTCKPVQVVKRMGADGEKQMLITADRNNDRKFRFLSEVTKPDYREVTKREDYDDIKRFRQLQEKLSERIAQRQSSESGDSSSMGSPRQSLATHSHDEMYSPLASPSNSPGAFSAPISVRVPSSAEKSSSSLVHSPNKIRRTQSPNISENNNIGNGNSCAVPATIADKMRCPRIPVGRVIESPPIIQSGDEINTTENTSRLPTIKSSRSVTPSADKLRLVNTRPGCIGPRSNLPREQTAKVKSFRIQSSVPSPKLLASTRSVSLGERQPIEPIIDSVQDASNSNPSVKDQTELQKLYTAQCRRVRELMSTLDYKDNRLNQLEMDIATLTNRYERVLVDCKRQHDDIESLRYEIDWKDKRIEYLEKQLNNTLQH